MEEQLCTQHEHQNAPDSTLLDDAPTLQANGPASEAPSETDDALRRLVTDWVVPRLIAVFVQEQDRDSGVSAEAHRVRSTSDSGGAYI